VSLITVVDVTLWCREKGMVVIGHNLELLIGEGKTVKVAVLARDRRDHFIAVSPITIEGQQGLGVIDLVTAEASFARLRAPLHQN